MRRCQSCGLFGQSKAVEHEDKVKYRQAGPTTRSCQGCRQWSICPIGTQTCGALVRGGRVVPMLQKRLQGCAPTPICGRSFCPANARSCRHWLRAAQPKFTPGWCARNFALGQHPTFDERFSCSMISTFWTNTATCISLLIRCLQSGSPTNADW